MTLYRLRLQIGYDFDRPAGAGRQLFRILPASDTPRQRLIRSRVEIGPAPGRETRFRDFFGTEVLEVMLPAGALSFQLTLEAELSRQFNGIAAAFAPPLSAIAGECAAVREVGPHAPHHFRGPSRLIPEVAAISAFARRAAADAPDSLAATEAFGLALHRHMTFDPKATLVDTAPAEAFAKRRGVCQDLAQIMIGGLRALGLPAAYVAGYLRTLPPPGKPRLIGADAMHAWVRVWLGRSLGWVDYDPTNACFVGADHIEVGFGRDYADVAPVTGVLRLEGAQSGRHSVDIEELAAPVVA